MEQKELNGIEKKEIVRDIYYSFIEGEKYVMDSEKGIIIRLASDKLTDYELGLTDVVPNYDIQKKTIEKKIDHPPKIVTHESPHVPSHDNLTPPSPSPKKIHTNLDQPEKHQEKDDIDNFEDRDTILKSFGLSKCEIKDVKGSTVEIIPYEESYKLIQSYISHEIFNGGSTIRVLKPKNNEKKNLTLIVKKKIFTHENFPEQAFGVVKFFQDASSDCNAKKKSLEDDFCIAPMLKISHTKKGNSYFFNFFQPYYVHGDLETYVNRHYGLYEHECKKIFFSMLKSLNYIHSLGYAHLDIKPSNFLLKPHLNSTVLIDFDCLTKRNELMEHTHYTAMYAAPEMTKSLYKHDPKKCDIFALGCTFLYCLTLHGVNQSFFRTKSSPFIGNNSYERMKDVYPFKYLSSDVGRLICSMVNEDPDMRKSAKEYMESDYFKDVKEVSGKVKNFAEKKNFRENVKISESFEFFVKNKKMLNDDKDFMRMVLQRIGLNFVFDEIVVKMEEISKINDFLSLQDQINCKEKEINDLKNDMICLKQSEKKYNENEDLMNEKMERFIGIEEELGKVKNDFELLKRKVKEENGNKKEKIRRKDVSKKNGVVKNVICALVGVGIGIFAVNIFCWMKNRIKKKRIV